MYKITSKIMGSIKIGNKDISYGGFITVDKLTQEIIDKQQSRIVTVKYIKEKEKIEEELKKERKNKKQDKNINGGN